MKKYTTWIALAIGMTAVIFSALFIYPAVKKLFVSVSEPIQMVVTGMGMNEVNEEFIEKYNPLTQRRFDVLHYNIKLDLLTEQKNINGDVTLTIKVNDKSSKEIDLNFYDNLTISAISINGIAARYERSKTILKLLTDEIFDDTIKVRIVYNGEPKSLGFGSFNFDKMEGKPLVYTMSEPVYASTWFPCIDVPDDKALLDIYITNDSSIVSLSNGKLISVTNDEARRTYHWKTFYPISTYLISIYSGYYRSYSDKYISLSGDTLKLFYYASPGKLEQAILDFNRHDNYLRTFEELFGDYPFIKEKYAVAEFGWAYGAMENQTITGVGSKYISGKKLFQDMIIHELAHHWWGNAVGPKTWKDIWLNEGFATYSEALYWEKQAGFSALQSTLNPKFGSFPKGSLYNPESNIFSRMIYDKGAWVLHMLRKELGDSTFFSALRTYFEKYKYKNASTEDFKSICEQISRKDLKYFFEQWVYKGEGIIEANFEWQTVNSAESFKTELRIKQLQNGYDIYKFPLDIKIFFENGSKPETKTFYIGSKEEILEMITEHKPLSVELDPDGWLLAEFINRNN